MFTRLLDKDDYMPLSNKPISFPLRVLFVCSFEYIVFDCDRVQGFHFSQRFILTCVLFFSKDRNLYKLYENPTDNPEETSETGIYTKINYCNIRFMCPTKRRVRILTFLIGYLLYPT